MLESRAASINVKIEHQYLRICNQFFKSSQNNNLKKIEKVDILDYEELEYICKCFFISTNKHVGLHNDACLGLGL
jgi:hypothetical protein